jgi:hypothetical protein
MKLEDLKSILDSLKNNPMAIWGLVFASIGTITTVTYQGITKYNDISAIVSGYDDTASAASSASRKVDTLTERLNSQQEAIIKLQERSSEALLNAREAKIVAESTQKEARASANATKVELEVTANSLRSEMNTLKRASTNRLGQ